MRQKIHVSDQANAAKLKRRGGAAAAGKGAGKGGAKAGGKGKGVAKAPAKPTKAGKKGAKSGAKAVVEDGDGGLDDGDEDDGADGALSDEDDGGDDDSSDSGKGGGRRSLRPRRAAARKPGKAGRARAASPDGSRSDRGGRDSGSGSEETYVSGESDVEDHGSFTSESEGEAKRAREVEAAEPLTLPIIHAATISRASLLKYIDEPFLKDMVVGSFVRVVSSKPKPGVKEVLYSVAQVGRWRSPPSPPPLLPVPPPLATLGPSVVFLSFCLSPPTTSLDISAFCIPPNTPCDARDPVSLTPAFLWRWAWPPLRRSPSLALSHQIADVVPCSTSYRVDDTRLNVALMLHIGTSKPKQFTLKLVSNQKPTQKEVDRWRAILTSKLQCDVPTAAWCRRRAEDMVSVRKNYRYTIADVKSLASKRSQDLRKLGSVSVLKAKVEQRVQLLQEKIQEMKDRDGTVDEAFEERYVEASPHSCHVRMCPLVFRHRLTLGLVSFPPRCPPLVRPPPPCAAPPPLAPTGILHT